MYRVGLTGGIGSGKSTAASCFSKLGVTVIYLDKLSRDMVAKNSPALKKIVEHFGQEILTGEDTLDRQALREIVFSNPQEKLWLESLLHPLIRERQEELIKKASSTYVVIEIPLLVENDLKDTVDRVLVVDVPEKVQISRAAERDSLDEAAIKAILDSQATRAERLAIADDVLENNGDVEELKAKVATLHQQYLQLAQSQ